MIETLQSLRFIFFIMIFMSHFEYDGIKAFDAGGDGGVSFFFILSGFILSHVHGKEIRNGYFNHKSFFLKRLKKIYPVHLLCLCAFIFLNIKVMDICSYVKLLPNILLLQSWIPLQEYYFSGNGVSWFLSDIVFCYAIFPFLYKTISNASWTKTCLGWGILLTCYFMMLRIVPEDLTNNIVYVNPLVRAIDFLIGITLCKAISYTTRKRMECPTIAISIIELVTVAATTAIFVAYPHVNDKIHTACLFWPILSLVVLVFASKENIGIVSRLLKSRILVYLGNASFNMYMIHHIIIGVTLTWASSLSGIEMPYIIALSLCLALTIAGHKAIKTVLR